jgi:hypothetical protein
MSVPNTEETVTAIQQRFVVHGGERPASENDRQPDSKPQRLSPEHEAHQREYRKNHQW